MTRPTRKSDTCPKQCAPAAFMVLTLLICGCGEQPSANSQTNYLVSDTQSAGLMLRLFDPAIEICADDDTWSRTHEAVAVWMRAIFPIDPQITTKIRRSCPGHGSVRIVDGLERSHTFMGSYPKVEMSAGTRVDQDFRVYLHEFGHAFGLLDTYVEKAYRCMPGQSESVMCNANSTTLQPDDVAGIRAMFRAAFPGRGLNDPPPGGSMTAQGTPLPQGPTPPAVRWVMGVAVKGAVNRQGADVGVVIKSTTPGGPAARAGMTAGDLITVINGKDVRTTSDWDRAVNAMTGETAVVQFLRRAPDGKPSRHQAMVRFQVSYAQQP